MMNITTPHMCLSLNIIYIKKEVRRTYLPDFKSFSVFVNLADRKLIHREKYSLKVRIARQVLTA